MPLKILAVPSFNRAFKKLHDKDKKLPQKAIEKVAGDPRAGEQKKGDFADVFVYEFKLTGQETLLAYRLMPDKLAPEEMTLLAIGTHENFYTPLKR